MKSCNLDIYPCRSLNRRLPLKMELVVFARLANFKILTRHVANQLIAIHADRTHVVNWLSLAHVITQLKNDVTLARFIHLVACFFSFEFILPPKLLAQIPEGFTDLDIHHVCGSQFRCQRVQKLRRFPIVGLLVGGQQLFNCFSSCGRFAGQTNRTASKAENLTNTVYIHFRVPSVILKLLKVIQTRAEAGNRHTGNRERAT